MFEMRELSREDIPAINSWRADRDTIGLLGAPYRFINQEVDEAWFEQYMRSRGGTVRCVTVDSELPSEPLCLITLAGIDWVNRSAELHVMASPSARNRGVGTFSVEFMLEHAFLDLGLNRVELDVLATNARALHVYEKAGFKSEGRRRQAVWKPSGYVDLIHMAVLSGWFEHKAEARSR